MNTNLEISAYDFYKITKDKQRIQNKQIAQAIRCCTGGVSRLRKNLTKLSAGQILSLAECLGWSKEDLFNFFMEVAKEWQVKGVKKGRRSSDGKNN